jgi:hypothetical protein
MRRFLILFAVLVLSLFMIGEALATPTPGVIYSTHGDGTRLGTINPASGVGTDVGAFGTSQTWAAAFDNATGILYTLTNGFSNSQLATVDLSTGATSPIGATGVPFMISLEVASDGTMYGVGYTDQVLYEIDKSTGAATAIGSTGITNLMDLAFDSSGTLYGTVGNVLWTINTATGASTLLGNITGVPAGSDMGIMFDDSDTLYATNYVNNGDLMTIDFGTLNSTVIGSTGFFFPHGGDFFNAIPEPATLLLIGTGLLGLVGFRRRFRK